MYRFFLVMSVVVLMAHCGKPHHGKQIKPAAAITSMQQNNTLGIMA